MLERTIIAVDKLSEKLAFVVHPSGTKVSSKMLHETGARGSADYTKGLRSSSWKRALPLLTRAASQRAVATYPGALCVTNVLLPPSRLIEGTFAGSQVDMV